MNIKFLNKINLFLLLSVVILAAQSLSAATRTVTKIQDTNDGVCNADCSLREAVGVAINGDQVTFAAGLAGQTVFVMNGVITIADKNIMITGLDNLSVSGDFKNRIFNITDGAIANINNLDMKEGFADQANDPLGFGGGGGAVVVHDGSNVVLSNSTLFDNHSAFGGAILVENSSLKLQNTIIRDNSAVHSGGGLSGQGKGVNVEISGSTFKFNSAQKGGAISFTNGKMRMTTTGVYQNVAVGASSTYGGGLFLTGTDFTQTNFGTEFLITNSSIHNNAGGIGGGIYNQGNLTLINTTVSSNSATKGEGGGLAHLATGGLLQGLLNIRNATITLNSAVTGGGGVVKFGDAGEFNFGNTVISANNSINNSVEDIKGAVNSLGYNFIGTTSGATINGDLTGNQINPNPMLAPLAYNGATTKNHFPQLGSPLLNAGSDALAVAPSGNPLTTDQRGQPRFYWTVDIGAVERQSSRDEPSGGGVIVP